MDGTLSSLIDDDQKKKIVSCAGKGGAEGDDHCGKPDCPVCTAFGFSKKGLSFQGLAQFSDARLLFFPVHSLVGPVWITCPSSLEAAGCIANVSNNNHEHVNWLQWNDYLDKQVEHGTPEVQTLAWSGLPDRINLGWVYLSVFGKSPTKAQTDPSTPRASQPHPAIPQEPSKWKIQIGEEANGPKFLGDIPILKSIANRIVLVSDRVFSVVVEDQLEVRTSVSISPLTGAAESGALFTYEALPRATFLFFQIIYLDPSLFRVPTAGAKNGKPANEVSSEVIHFNGADEPAKSKEIASHVEGGLALAEFLGIGGSNTRGLGRMKIFPVESSSVPGKEQTQ
jgi:CRISPR-associated protein Cmr4